MNLLHAYGDHFGMRLEIYSGNALDLDSQNAVLVNPSNKTLMLGGSGIAKQILERGGRTIQEECAEILKKIKDLDTAGCVVTGAGSLHFRNILHVCSPHYNYLPGTDFEKCDMLVTAICNALEVAEEVSRTGAVNTAVFPLISAGICGYPLDTAARCFIQSFVIFAQRPLLNRKLNKVMISLYTSAELDAVIGEFMELSYAFINCVVKAVPTLRCRTCGESRSLETSEPCGHVCSCCVYRDQLAQCPICQTALRVRDFNCILCEKCLTITNQYSHHCRRLCNGCLQRYYTGSCICGNPS